MRFGYLRGREERWFAPFLGLVALATLAFNAWGRAGWAFWPDEAYTALAARAPDWSSFLQVNLRNEETPPLYFALLRLWAQGWGRADEAVLRGFSALALAVATALIGVLGARLWSRTVGAWAAVLVAVNPFVHMYGQEARGYTWAVLLVTAVALVGHAYDARPTPARWLGYVVVGMAALWSNYFTAFVLAGVGGLVGIRLGWRWRQTRTSAHGHALLGWVAAQMAILLAYIPWLGGVQYQVMVAQATLVPDGTSGAKKALLALLLLGANVPNGQVLHLLLLGALLGALLMAPAILLLRRRDVGTVWIMTLLIVPVIGAVGLLYGDGQFTPRYLLVALPGYVLLIVAGLWDAPLLRPVMRGLLMVLVGLSLVQSLVAPPNKPRRSGWWQAADTVAAQAQPGDAVIFAPPWCEPAFTLQYDGPTLPMYGAGSFAAYYYDRGRPYSETLDAPALAAQLAQHGRAWIVWDRNYARPPELPANVRVEEQSWGTTSVLLVTVDD